MTGSTAQHMDEAPLLHLHKAYANMTHAWTILGADGHFHEADLVAKARKTCYAALQKVAYQYQLTTGKQVTIDRAGHLSIDMKGQNQ